MRGVGLILGIKCRKPNTDLVVAARNAGVLVVPAADNVLRLLPALNISDDDINEAITRLDAAATAVEAS